MKLYSAAISPYASRCRIQIQHKNLPVEILPPPGGMGSDEVKAKNPVGKIPVLDLGDQALAESWAIMEYLENRFPDIPMRPADAFAAARQSEIVRFVDLYLAPAMFPLFLALRGAGDQDTVDKALTGLGQQLKVLDALLSRDDYANKAGLDLVDAALLPIIWYARVLARHFSQADCLEALPTTLAWWQRASSEAAASLVLDEMQTGLAQAMPTLFE